MTEIDRARDALNHIDAGCPRDEWVRLGMAAKSAGLDFEDFNTWSASASNYSGENECRTVWKSIGETGGVTPATLFGMAISQGWSDSSKTRTKELNGSRPAITSKATTSPTKSVKQAAGANAVQVWERCIPATPAEAYIHKKQGKPDGLRVYPASAEPLYIGAGDDRINATGGLVVPCYALDGVTLQTLQIIPLVGQKKNLPGASFGDGFFTVGTVTDCAYIVEGIGQAWAINKATGKAAVVTFGSARMATVAKALREKYPALQLVIVPDRGMEDKAAKIAADVSAQWIALPSDKPSNYDVNDYAIEFGTITLADMLQHLVAPAMRYSLLSDDDLRKLPALQWRIKKVLPERGLAAVYGASGSGKSFAVIDMAQAIAAGH